MRTVKEIVAESRKFEKLKAGDKLVSKITDDDLIEGQIYLIDKVEFYSESDPGGVHWKGIFLQELPYLYDRLCCVNRFYTLKEYRTLKLKQLKNK